MDLTRGAKFLSPNKQVIINIHSHVVKEHEVFFGTPNRPLPPMKPVEEIPSEQLFCSREIYPAYSFSVCKKATVQLYFGCTLNYTAHFKDYVIDFQYDSEKIAEWVKNRNEEFVQLLDVFFPAHTKVNLVGVKDGFFICINFNNADNQTMFQPKSVGLVTSNNILAEAPSADCFWMSFGDTIIDGVQQSTNSCKIISRDSLIENSLSPTSGVLKIEY